MDCSRCGITYYVADAQPAFDSNYNYDLSYYVEISLGSTERNLCGDCAVDYMENKIRSQEGYDEAVAEDH